MAKLSKMSTTTKILLVAGVGVGVYFVVRSLKKPEEAQKKLEPVSPPDETGGGSGLPPSDTGGPPQAKPRDAPAFNSALKDLEPATAVAYHAQWAAGNLESKLQQAIGGAEITAGRITNILTDWAYIDIYGRTAYPIPANWQGSSWQPFAAAWSRIRSQMSRLVNTTLESEEGVS